MKKILFISYDGMTDPLGQSQVIPYLSGLSREGYEVFILSFEKKEKLHKLGKFISSKLQEAKIKWHPLPFHSSPPIISKWWDVQLMKKKAGALHKKEKFDLLHCRSYISADIGLSLKRKTGVKLLFDMRGFWADEKAEGGNWDKKNFFWKRVYSYYKKKEKELITESDHIITLTNAAKKEIQSWSYYNPNVPISVIPCCADTDIFTLKNQEQKFSVRKKINIPEESFVLSYLGSVGSWYMLDEMLEFFSYLLKQIPDSFFLFITNSNSSIITEKLNAHGLKADRLKIIQVNYIEVPEYMAASDASISFIKPVFSKTGSSPTKMGETLCMGIPLVTNDVGDCGEIIRSCEAGYLVKDFSSEEYNKIISELKISKIKNAGNIRTKAMQYFSLRKGIEKYKQVYTTLLT